MAWPKGSSLFLCAKGHAGARTVVARRIIGKYNHQQKERANERTKQKQSFSQKRKIKKFRKM